MSTYYGYVYLTVNKTDGMLYCGRHKTEKLNPKYVGSGSDLKPEVKAHGKKNFTCEPLLWCKDRKDLSMMEEFFLKAGDAENNPEFYNRTNQSYGGNVGPHSEETRRKMSATHMGHVQSAESRRKMSESHKGKVLSPEHRAKLSEAKRGKPHPKKEQTCPHCGLVSRGGIIRRWHFDKCKFK